MQKNLTKGKACGFMGPYLPRRIAQSAWEMSGSGCPSSTVAFVVCKPLGRVSLDAHDDEQRRKQAEARVSCSLPSFLWTSIRKNGRLKAKRYVVHIAIEESEIAIASASMQ